ncbi:hypothetical protein B0H63DRAFT_519961 [Podospora didyma]|uniref:Uncharacterized protein n=1 Tax=Podospora didyma TaxID=330526 RepID=A0AAE0NZW3_9PEZI|nr:hypothetical protein B0H63DRAFT_519961 [Podospora didyma]
MSSTTAAALALITPFAQPPSCSEIFSTTSLVSSFWWNQYSTTTVQILASADADAENAPPGFASTCRPPGWNTNVPLTNRFSFSPAVCPSGWTAYKLQTAEMAWPITSTAYCCDRDYRLEWPTSDLSISGIASPACFKNLGTTFLPGSSPSSPSSLLFPNGIQVHNAWHISWAASDTSSLSPPPPDLACGGGARSLSTWIPGETVPPLPPNLNTDVCQDMENNSGGGVDDTHQPTPMFLFMVVGLPLIFVAIILSVFVFCFRHRRRNKNLPRGAGSKELAVSIAD